MGNNPPLPIFDVDADKSTVGVRWMKWIDRFENYLKAANITDAERKKAQVLHFAGETVYDIATSLDLTPRARDRTNNVPAESVYDALKRVLNEHFHPKANKEYNRYLFRQAKQGTEESLDHFYARLKKLTMGCEFAEVEAEIKSHLICTCRLARLRRAALEDPSMTLDTMLEKGRTFELAQLQMSKIDERYDNRQVNRMKQRNDGFNRGQQQQQHDQNQNNHINKEGTSGPLKKDCPFCGSKYHRDGLSNCPARGKTCNNCNKLNHFSSVCFKKPYDNEQMPTPATTEPANSKDVSKGAIPKTTSFANNIQQDTDGEEEGNCFAVQSTQLAPRVKLELGNNVVTFLLDTGSDSTIIDQQTYYQIGRPWLTTTSKKIYAFNAQQPVPLWGAFKQVMKLLNTDQQVVEEIYVTKSNNAERILSFAAAQQLECLSFSSHVKISQPSTNPNKNGKRIGVKTKLHIDPNVRPVALSHRRIPYRHVTPTDIDGVINAGDDNPNVQEKTQQEHDQRLIRVRQRLKEKNRAVQEDSMQLSRHPESTQQPVESGPTKVAERCINFLSSAADPRHIPPDQIIVTSNSSFFKKMVEGKEDENDESQSEDRKSGAQQDPEITPPIQPPERAADRTRRPTRRPCF